MFKYILATVVSLLGCLIAYGQASSSFDDIKSKSELKVLSNQNKISLQIPLSYLNKEMILIERLVSKPANDSTSSLLGFSEKKPLHFFFSDNGSIVDVMVPKTGSEMRIPNQETLKAYQANHKPYLQSSVDVIKRTEQALQVDATKLFLNSSENVVLSQKKQEFDLSNSSVLAVKTHDTKVSVKLNLQFEKEEEGKKQFVVDKSIIILPTSKINKRLKSSLSKYDQVTFNTYTETDVLENKVITRWNITPNDKEAYLKGKTLHPERRITILADPNFPKEYIGQIKNAAQLWNKAFKHAGFKHVFQLHELKKGETALFDYPNERYISISFDTSKTIDSVLLKREEGIKSKTIFDPRSGEILQAEISIKNQYLKTLYCHQFMMSAPNISNKGKLPDLSEQILSELTKQLGFALGMKKNLLATTDYSIAEFKSGANISSSVLYDIHYNYLADINSKKEQKTGIKIGEYDKLNLNYGYRYTGINNLQEDKRQLHKAFLDHQNKPKNRVHSDNEIIHSKVILIKDPTMLPGNLSNQPLEASILAIDKIKKAALNKALVDLASSIGVYDVFKKYINHQFDLHLTRALYVLGGSQRNRPTPKNDCSLYTYFTIEEQKAALNFVLNQLKEIPGWMSLSELNLNDTLITNTQIEKFIKRVTSKELMYSLYAIEQQNNSEVYTPMGFSEDLLRLLFIEPLKKGSLTLVEKKMQIQYIDLIKNELANKNRSADYHNFNNKESPYVTDAFYLPILYNNYLKIQDLIKTINIDDPEYLTELRNTIDKEV